MGEHVSGIAVDSQGNAYVTGSTLRTGFPVTSGAFQTEITVESGRGFIAKLNATGSALMYATYLSSSIQAIAVDPDGQAVLVRITGATDHHPVTSGAFQTQLRGPARRLHHQAERVGKFSIIPATWVEAERTAL